ncbi:hypothetical protein Tco_1087127 [Tanacetum coccineum]
MPSWTSSESCVITGRVEYFCKYDDLPSEYYKELLYGMFQKQKQSKKHMDYEQVINVLAIEKSMCEDELRATKSKLKLYDSLKGCLVNKYFNLQMQAANARCKCKLQMLACKWKLQIQAANARCKCKMQMQAANARCKCKLQMLACKWKLQMQDENASCKYLLANASCSLKGCLVNKYFNLQMQAATTCLQMQAANACFCKCLLANASCKCKLQMQTVNASCKCLLANASCSLKGCLVYKYFNLQMQAANAYLQMQAANACLQMQAATTSYKCKCKLQMLACKCKLQQQAVNASCKCKLQFQAANK